MPIYSGNIVDIPTRSIYPGTLNIENGRISGIDRDNASYDTYLLPGFIDAHIHIESSLLVPSEFAKLAVQHGTVATVSDPHEIGNVLGTDGVEYMIQNGDKTPFKFYFGAPSCVPATPFETAGAAIDSEDVAQLLDREEIRYLSEVMNVPGVLNENPELLAKIEAAHTRNKPVDGHAPGVTGDELIQYVRAGIQTDHESSTYDEAKEKLEAGMKIMIREGSAARNFDALIPLLAEHAERCMFCSDDKHPDSLLEDHIDDLVRRALDRGLDRFDVLQAACLNPVEHYGLDVGTLQEGDPADFIQVENLETFPVIRTVIEGTTVFGGGKNKLPDASANIVNQFNAQPVEPAELKVPAKGDRIRVIQAIDRQLRTKEEIVEPPIRDDVVVSNQERDIAKLVVLNRYEAATPCVGFVTGFGLSRGALASSVAHDSHNIVAVGMSDDALVRAINETITHNGGLTVTNGDSFVETLPLPVAGLMSDQDAQMVANHYIALDRIAREELGAKGTAPFMTLSFLALLVIPELKLSDRGLFDSRDFEFTSLFV